MKTLMKTFTTLLLTLGLCGLSLPAFAANESCSVDGSAPGLDVIDLVQMVNAILGGPTVICAGPDCEECSDNQDISLSGCLNNAPPDLCGVCGGDSSTCAEGCVASGGTWLDGSCATGLWEEQAEHVAVCQAGTGDNYAPVDCAPTNHCFLMGLCGQDGANLGIGQYAAITVSDAVAVSWSCEQMYNDAAFIYHYFTFNIYQDVCAGTALSP